MSTQMIPIDPDKKDDMFYRYKMPAVQTKVEGSGNGIKTVIPNIHEICIAINRPEEVLMKFYQFELGAQRTVSAKDDKFLLMGSHSTERMQDKLYDFIRKFVLCKHCRNPETAVDLGMKKGSPFISMVCGACGKGSSFDDHRALTVMTQYYDKHPEEAKAAKGAAEARKKEGAEAAPAAAGKAPRARAAAAAQTVQNSDLSDNRTDPKVIVAKEMKKYESAPMTVDTTKDVITFLVRVMTEYNLPEVYGPIVIINSLNVDHKEDWISSMRHFREVLRRFCTAPELYARQETFDEKELTDLQKRESKIQKAFLRECARICAVEYKSADKMAALVFMLFVEGIVRDKSIDEWSVDKVNSDVGEALDKEMKTMGKSIVQWLGLRQEESS